MARCINDCVVPLLSVELLGGACNCDTTLALFLLTIHVEGKGKRALTQALCLLLQLLQLTLRESTKLKDKTTSGSALATVNMATDDNGEVFLFRVGNHCERGRNL